MVDGVWSRRGRPQGADVYVEGSSTDVVNNAYAFIMFVVVSLSSRFGRLSEKSMSSLIFLGTAHISSKHTSHKRICGPNKSTTIISSNARVDVLFILNMLRVFLVGVFSHSRKCYAFVVRV